MVIWTVKYLVDKKKMDEYRKFSQEQGIPHWLSTPGLKEIRGLVDETTREILFTAEFASYEAWGKAMDDPKTENIMETFRSLTHDVTWRLWSPAPRVPEPLRPN